MKAAASPFFVRRARSFSYGVMLALCRVRLAPIQSLLRAMLDITYLRVSS